MADINTGRAGSGAAATRVRDLAHAAPVNGTLSVDVSARLATALGLADASSMAWLESSVEIQVLPARAVLFREGDPSEALYLVLSGELEATVASAQHGETLVGRIGPGEPVGEMQILTRGARTATVRAIAGAELARVSRHAIERLHDMPEVVAHLTDAIDRRGRRNQLATILPTLFGVIDEAMLREVEAGVTWMTLARGATLFEQGEPGERGYLLVNGRLQAAVRDAAGGEKLVGEIVRGEIVGEMALLTGEPRSACVRALRDSELVVLDRATFDRLIVTYPQMLMALTRLVITRLREAQNGAREESPARTFALIAAGPGVPLSSFARRLADALGRLGSTLHLAAADVDSRLGTPGASQTPPGDPRATRVTSWLDEQELRHRFVILETDAAQSAWAARCVRHADRLLVVGRAGDDPTPGAEERTLVGPDATAPPTSLVLLHSPETTLPSGTRRWLEGRRLLRHHHVRDGDEEAVPRVARFLAGRAIGVALSGGGARGFAHVGALEALREAGVPVDMIGGTSMGAFIAAEYALGWDGPTMAARNQEIFGQWRRDLTLPLLSLLGGRRSRARLAQRVGDVQIEDLWVPYFCVSSNLSRAEMMVHRTGSLWRSMRASGSLPGVLPPVVWDGELLVDGGLLRNLPADVLRDLTGGGTTIAIDVSVPIDMKSDYPYEDAISGWRILWSRLRRSARSSAVPSMAVVLQRSAELASVAMQRESLLRGVDLYVRVPVQQFGILEFDRAGDIIATGLHAARQELAARRQRSAGEWSWDS